MSKYKHTFTVEDLLAVYEAHVELERQALKVKEDMIFGMFNRGFGNRIFGTYQKTMNTYNGKWMLYAAYIDNYC